MPIPHRSTLVRGAARLSLAPCRSFTILPTFYLRALRLQLLIPRERQMHDRIRTRIR